MDQRGYDRQVYFFTVALWGRRLFCAANHNRDTGLCFFVKGYQIYQTLTQSILSGSGFHSCHFGVIEFNGFIESRVSDSVVVLATRNFAIMWHLSISESQSWVYFPDRVHFRIAKLGTLSRSFIAESQSWVHFPHRIHFRIAKLGILSGSFIAESQSWVYFPDRIHFRIAKLGILSGSGSFQNRKVGYTFRIVVFNQFTGMDRGF